MLRTALLAGVAIVTMVAAARADIKVATVGPMTGEYAAFGRQMRLGAEQAIKDINQAGGVMGQQLVLSIEDDACDPRQAVSVANKLASQKVSVVAGHFCSGSSIPASKVYTEEGILQISPASTNPKYTDEGSWNTLRVCGRDDQQGDVAGKYLADHFKDKKIAILHDNSAYGKGLADETRRALGANGGKETMYAAYTPGERDYSAIVSRMKQAGVDLIYVGGYHTETGLIARQAKEQGMNVTIVGGDALVSNEFWQIAGQAGQGTLMTFPSDPRKRPSAQSVVGEFKAANVDPEGYVLYTYAAIQVWADAVKKANSIDAKKVSDTLHDGSTFQTVLGSLAFTKKGDITQADYVLYVWKDGSYSAM